MLAQASSTHLANRGLLGRPIVTIPAARYTKNRKNNITLLMYLILTSEKEQTPS